MSLSRRWGEFVVRRPRPLIAVVLVLTALCAVGATRPRLSIREQDQLPQSHPDVQVYNRINEGFGSGAAVVIGVLPHGGDAFTPATLASVARIIGADFVLPGPSPNST